jgi:hypothetical protein
LSAVAFAVAVVALPTAAVAANAGATTLTALSGTLQAAGGQPVPGTTVGLSDRHGSTASTTTSSTGSFSVSVADEGEPFSLGISGTDAVAGLPAYWTFDGDDTISMASVHSIAPTLPAIATLTMVVTGGGSPVPGAGVIVEDYGHWLESPELYLGALSGSIETSYVGGTTGPRGSASITTFPASASTWSVTPLSGSTYGNITVSVPAISGPTTVDVSLRPPSAPQP